MNDERNLAISVAEMLIQSRCGGSEWWHSFWMLTDETLGRGKKSKVVQEIHLNGDDDGCITVELYHKDRSLRKREEIIDVPFLSKREQIILPVWNHILKNVCDISSQGIELGKDFKYARTALNCRSIVRCVNRTIGVSDSLYDQFNFARAGVDADVSHVEVTPFNEKELEKPLSLSRVKFDMWSSYFPSVHDAVKP